MEMLITIAVSILASSGLWGLVQFLINRRDKTSETLESIVNKIDELDDKINSNNATQSRSRILRFDDELVNGVHHSQEYFQQILQDIDVYETFCSDHPTYKNNCAKLAISHIEKVYADLQSKGGFI